jgi:hypothetical protein
MAITMNGGRSKEGNGDGNKGGGRVTATTTKRRMATAMRVVGDKEGNGSGGESDGRASRVVGDGNGDGNSNGNGNEAGR